MIPYLETHIVDHCNLKCRGCSHFSGLSKPSFRNFLAFDRDMERLAAIEEVQTLRIMGGEPLLHPDYLSFFRSARAHFPHAKIVLVTNGILLHTIVADIPDLNRLGITLCVSNYDQRIDWGLYDRFQLHEIHMKTAMYNISLDLEGSQTPEYAFGECDLARSGWWFLGNGKIFTCCIMANIDIFNESFDTAIDGSDAGISIYDHDGPEIERFLRTPHAVCRFCNTWQREKSYERWAPSKGVIEEWTCR